MTPTENLALHHSAVSPSHAYEIPRTNLGVGRPSERQDMTCKTKWTAPTSPLTPLTLIGLLGLLGGCQSPTVSPAAPAPAHAASTPPKVDTGAALFAACRDQDGLDSWDMPAPPAKIHGSTYYVGTCGIAAILIDTADGLILIDAATQ
jgi:hypothetical protein